MFYFMHRRRRSKTWAAIWATLFLAALVRLHPLLLAVPAVIVVCGVMVRYAMWLQCRPKRAKTVQPAEPVDEKAVYEARKLLWEIHGGLRCPICGL